LHCVLSGRAKWSIAIIKGEAGLRAEPAVA